MLIDPHAHLDSPRYAEDREALLDRAWAAGVRTILSIGIGEGPDTMHQALDLCRQYKNRPATPKLFASAGVHPHESSNSPKNPHSPFLDQLLAEPACGDWPRLLLRPPRETQQQVFRRQMEIAAAHKQPIIIHCRPSDNSTNAWDDTLDMIEEQWKPTGFGGILHCFTGEWDHARRALDADFLVSFAGNITFPKAQPIRDAAALVPLDRILVETDAPFLAPIPNRGKRNEPACASQALSAEVRGIDPETAASRTTENFHRFFPGIAAAAGTD